MMEGMSPFAAVSAAIFFTAPACVSRGDLRSCLRFARRRSPLYPSALRLPPDVPPLPAGPVPKRPPRRRRIRRETRCMDRPPCSGRSPSARLHLRLGSARFSDSPAPAPLLRLRFRPARRRRGDATFAAPTSSAWENIGRRSAFLALSLGLELNLVVGGEQVDSPLPLRPESSRFRLQGLASRRPPLRSPATINLRAIRERFW